MHRAAFAIVAGAAAAVSVWWLDGRDGNGARAAHREPGGCDGFDFPVGAPDAEGYRDSQPFGDADHLGEDWNGVGGGDSDLGDPVTAIGDGVVADASDHAGGWGNVVRIIHLCSAGGRDADDPPPVESLYAHLDTIDVAPGQIVRRGDRLGTIGTAHGMYLAHLHLELRARPGLPLGGGYAQGEAREGHLDPSAYISTHRPAP
jgi:murein DD-endopeptidase MepM/ murein hydrolase activator NlpD